MISDQKIITAVQQYIENLEFLYLFGSVANNSDTHDSDIDLAFYTEMRMTNQERWEAQQKLSVHFGRQVDLVDMSTASDIMRMQIVSKGQLLYARNTANIDSFENNIFYRYIDLRESNKGIYHDIAQSGKIYG